MKDYKSAHAVKYEQPDRKGITVIPILHFLWGRKWDQLALNYVHAVHPSVIRVTEDEIKTDSWLYRVTVWIDKNDTIEKIDQEVMVGLEGGYKNGYELDCALEGVQPAKPIKLNNGQEVYCFINLPTRHNDNYEYQI